MLHQFYTIFPPGSGITWATISLGIEALTLTEIDRVRSRIVDAALRLAESGVDIVVQSGVPVVVSRGVGYDREVVNDITTATGLPAISDIGSTISALRYLGVTRLAVATPFDEEMNRLVKDFLERSGFQVVLIEGLRSQIEQRPLSFSTAQLSLEQTYNFAKKIAVQAQGAEALYVPGAPMPFVENIAPLEMDLGKPVVAALPAMIWNCLNTLKIHKTVSHFGCLLKSLS